MRDRHKKALRFIFAGLVTAVIFVFLSKNISFGKLLCTIKNADLRIIILTWVIALFSNTLLVSYRWKLILQELHCPISLREALFIKIGSRIFPFKTNEVSRILYLKRLKEIPYPKAIFSVVSEYLLSTLALLFFIAIGLVLYNTGLARLDSAFSPSNYDIFLVSGVIFGLRQSLRKDMWPIYLQHLADYTKQFSCFLKNKRIILISILYWGLDLLNVYLLSLAVDNPLPIFGILLFVPLIIFAGGFKITLGGIGLREITLIFLFSSYGSREVLLSISLLYYLTEQIVPTALSLFFSGAYINKMVWK